MEENNEKRGRKCFIITPIGNENSDTFRKAKGVIESVIKPVLEKNGFSYIKPSYEINVSGMISSQIINRIIDDDLVVANLTGNNPNVMYELCLRHVSAKPIIHICEEGTVLPFDIKDSRTIFYRNDMLGVNELKEKLNLFLCSMNYDIEYRSNPIYTSVQYGNLLKEAVEPKENEQLSILIEMVSSINEIKREINKGKSIYEDKNMFSDNFKVDFKNINFSDLDKKMAKDLLDDPPIVTPTIETLAEGLNISVNSLMFAANMAGVDIENIYSDIDKKDLRIILIYIINNV